MSDEWRDPRVRSETSYWIDCTVCGPQTDPPPPKYASDAELWQALLNPDSSGWTRRTTGASSALHIGNWRNATPTATR